MTLFCSEHGLARQKNIENLHFVSLFSQFTFTSVKDDDDERWRFNVGGMGLEEYWDDWDGGGSIVLKYSTILFYLENFSIFNLEFLMMSDSCRIYHKHTIIAL